MTYRVTKMARPLVACLLMGIGFGDAAGDERSSPAVASVPKVAKVFKADVVQAFARCTAPDTSALGEPACTGPLPASEWNFGSLGRGTLLVKSRRVSPDESSPCIQGVTGLVYKVKLKDVRGPNGLPFTTVAGEPTLTLTLTARVSHLFGCPDCIDRDCAAPDLAMDAVDLDCQEGTCRAQGQDSLVGAGTNIGLTFTIRDPDGNTFAVPGERIKGGPAVPAFPTVRQAQLVQTHLVGAATECTAPTAMAGGMSVCRPIVRPSSYRFGSDGWGQVVLKRRGDEHFVKVKLKDVRDAAHVPVTGAFTLSYVDRRTSEAGCAAPPCTRIDLVVRRSVACQSGRCSATISDDDPGFAGGSVEVSSLVVLDPGDASFAVPGLKTR